MLGIHTVDQRFIPTKDLLDIIREYPSVKYVTDSNVRWIDLPINRRITHLYYVNGIKTDLEDEGPFSPLISERLEEDINIIIRNNIDSLIRPVEFFDDVILGLRGCNISADPRSKKLVVLLRGYAVRASDFSSEDITFLTKDNLLNE